MDLMDQSIYLSIYLIMFTPDYFSLFISINLSMEGAALCFAENIFLKNIDTIEKHYRELGPNRL